MSIDSQPWHYLIHTLGAQANTAINFLEKKKDLKCALWCAKYGICILKQRAHPIRAWPEVSYDHNFDPWQNALLFILFLHSGNFNNEHHMLHEKL